MASLRSSEIICKFNLCDSLEIQIELLQHHLELARSKLTIEQIAKSTPVRHKYPLDMLPTYLRVLDALFSGAKRTEISQVLFPDEPNTQENGYLINRRVKQMEKAATEIMNGAYVRIYRAGLRSARTFPGARSKEKL